MNQWSHDWGWADVSSIITYMPWNAIQMEPATPAVNRRRSAHLLMECQGHSTLHFRLNEGSLQNTIELHQMLSSEQTINIILNYVRENEELRRIWPAKLSSSHHSKSSPTDWGQSEGKLKLKPWWSTMDQYIAPEWFKRKENRRRNPWRISQRLLRRGGNRDIN